MSRSQGTRQIAGPHPGAAFSRPATDVVTRLWSAKSDASENKEEFPEPKESLQDTINRMKQKEGKDQEGDNGNEQFDSVLRNVADKWSIFSEEVGKTWGELLKSGDRKDINKKLVSHHPEDTAEGEAPYTGTVDIMVIDPNEHLTAWERMQRRLTEAPIISGKC